MSAYRHPQPPKPPSFRERFEESHIKLVAAFLDVCNATLEDRLPLGVGSELKTTLARFNHLASERHLLKRYAIREAMYECRPIRIRMGANGLEIVEEGT